MSIPLPISPKSDRLIWTLDSKGLFLVKSASRISVDQEPNPSQAEVPWKKLWKARLPERIKMLIWRIGNSSLPTNENLSCRLEYIDPNCTLCKNGWESCVRLFFECPIARALWLSSCWGLRVDTSMLQTNEDIIKLIIEPPTSTISAHDQWLITLNVALILDEIWYSRNHICYQDAWVDIPKSIHTVQAKFLEYSKLHLFLLPPSHHLVPQPGLPAFRMD